MHSHTTLFKKIHVAALLTFVALLSFVGNSQSKDCPENQYARERTQTGGVNQGGGGGYTLIECVDCPWPKYGTGGQCYDCPSFTRARKTKDPSGTLWCTNDCNEIIKNEQNNDVQNLADPNHLGRGVFQFSGETPTCQLCTADKFEVKHKAGTVLLNFKNEIISLGFQQNKIDKLIEEKNRLLHFTWTICSSCPPGFIKGKWAAPEGSSITVIEGLMIPCQSCSINEGVQKNSKCEHCKESEWQELKLQSFLPYTSYMGYFIGFQFFHATAYVAQTCLTCPDGSQKLKTLESKGQWSSNYCRGKEAADCCSQCPENTYKGNVQEKCELVDRNHVAVSGNNFVETGATAQRTCNNQERMAVCFVGTHCLYTILSNWRTCLPCALDGTVRSEKDKSGCKACSLEKQHLVDPTDSGKCTTCSLCQELTTTETEDALNSLQNFKLITSPYTVLRVNAACTELKRRKLTKTDSVLKIEGNDYWRPAIETRGVVIPSFHFFHRTTCKLKECKEACTNRFQYGNGCGVDNDANTWVKSPDSKVFKLGSINANDVSEPGKWEVLTEGNCQFCTACVAGFYNEGCNSFGTSSPPEGKCKPCVTECAPNFFLSHPEQDAGCHEPPKYQHTAEDSTKFQILDDYTCVKCPTWVRKGHKIFVVSACGRHNVGDTYQHFDSQMQGSQILKTSKLVEIGPDSSTKIAGVEKGNFRTFANNLKPYCPPKFFFDKQNPVCNFINQGENFEFPNKTKVEIGYNEYNPLCCKKCTVCEPPLKKKDIDSWKSCEGDSDEDLQNKCVDKCVLGYWQDGEEYCRRCSTCYDGILPST